MKSDRCLLCRERAIGTAALPEGDVRLCARHLGWTHEEIEREIEKRRQGMLEEMGE